MNSRGPRREWGVSIHPLTVIARDSRGNRIRLSKCRAAIGGVRCGNSRHQSQAGKWQIRNSASACMIHCNINVPAAFRDSKQIAAVGQDAAAVRLSQIDKWKRAVLVGWSFLNDPAPAEIYTTGNTPDACNVDRPL